METVGTATPAGADKQTDQDARVKSARELMMERIDERHEQAISDQLLQPGTEGQATDGETIQVDDPKRYAVRVKIGDREEERSLDTVLNELQSSQGRLRSLSQRERELAAALAEKERLLEQQLTQQFSGQAAMDEDVDGRVAEVIKALGDGDPDTAATALRDVLKGRQTATPVNEAQLVGKLKAELAQEQYRAETMAIWDRFVEENPDFAPQLDADGNPVLSEARQYGDFLFERDYRARMEAGEISYQQALIETAEAVRKVLSGKPQGSETTKPSMFDERQERKRQLDQLPVAAGARSADQAPGGDESHAEVIRQMRKARGLPV